MPRPSPALAFLCPMTIVVHTHLHWGHPWAASERLYPSVALPSFSFMLFTLLLHQRGEREIEWGELESKVRFAWAQSIVHTSCPAAGAWAGFLVNGRAARISETRQARSEILIALHDISCRTLLLHASEAEEKRWDGEDRHPITHRPTRTGGEAQRQRPCSLSSAFPSFFPFLTSSPLSCMHACAHACVHICLLVCQRPPDDRSGLGTWFLVMIDHWTDRRTCILRNTAFNFDSPYPDTHIYAHTRTQAHARSYVTRIRALSSSACECVVGVPLGICACLCRVRRALGFKLQGIYWGISLRCLPTRVCLSLLCCASRRYIYPSSVVPLMLHIKKVHTPITRGELQLALHTLIPIAPPSLPLRYMRTYSMYLVAPHHPTLLSRPPGNGHGIVPAALFVVLYAISLACGFWFAVFEDPRKGAGE